MERIRVSPDGMDQAAARMAQQANEWQTNVDQVKTCVVQLDSMWEGLGNNSFNNIWNEHAQNFVRLHQMMQQYHDAIRAAANKFRQTEQQVSSIVSRR